MNPCCSAFGCDDLEGITKVDLDRFTDKIDNVLCDEKGRKLFKNYMITCKMKGGQRVLEFWEKADRLSNYRKDSEDPSFRKYLSDIDRLIDDSERIEELDYDVIKNLFDAREEEEQELIVESLKILKLECSKALRKEYHKFRIHFIPTKYKYFA